MSDEFMLASREAEEVLKKGDVITTTDGEEYTFHEVSDWAYLYSDRDVRVSPVDVTHVNGEPKRFGYKGLQDKVYQVVLEALSSGDTSQVEGFIREETLTMYSRYYNIDHPKMKGQFKWLLERD